jgi:hypothetical protein
MHRCVPSRNLRSQTQSAIGTVADSTLALTVHALSPKQGRIGTWGEPPARGGRT